MTDNEAVAAVDQDFFEIIERVRGQLIGEPASDLATINAAAEGYRDHPYGQELLREFGRMWYMAQPADVQAELDKLTAAQGDGFQAGLRVVQARVGDGDFEGARSMLEKLIDHHVGAGRFADDNVSEYRCFRNGFEAALYERLYHPARTVRQLPEDWRSLYHLYGAVLLEVRELAGAEVALRNALRLNPVDASSMFELGEVLKLQGRWDELWELTLQALAVCYIAEDAARGLRNLGFIACERADYDLAASCYFASIATHHESAARAQAELFYIQERSGSMITAPEPDGMEALLAAHGIRLGPSEAVAELLAEAHGPVH